MRRNFNRNGVSGNANNATRRGKRGIVPRQQNNSNQGWVLSTRPSRALSNQSRRPMYSAPRRGPRGFAQTRSNVNTLTTNNSGLLLKGSEILTKVTGNRIYSFPMNPILLNLPLLSARAKTYVRHRLVSCVASFRSASSTTTTGHIAMCLSATIIEEPSLEKILASTKSCYGPLYKNATLTTAPLMLNTKWNRIYQDSTDTLESHNYYLYVYNTAQNSLNGNQITTDVGTITLSYHFQVRDSQLSLISPEIRPSLEGNTTISPLYGTNGTNLQSMFSWTGLASASPNGVYQLTGDAPSMSMWNTTDQNNAAGANLTTARFVHFVRAATGTSSNTLVPMFYQTMEDLYTGKAFSLYIGSVINVKLIGNLIGFFVPRLLQFFKFSPTKFLGPDGSELPIINPPTTLKESISEEKSSEEMLNEKEFILEKE